MARERIFPESPAPAAVRAVPVVPARRNPAVLLPNPAALPLSPKVLQSPRLLKVPLPLKILLLRGKARLHKARFQMIPIAGEHRTFANFEFFCYTISIVKGTASDGG